MIAAHHPNYLILYTCQALLKSAVQKALKIQQCAALGFSEEFERAEQERIFKLYDEAGRKCFFLSGVQSKFDHFWEFLRICLGEIQGF